MKKHILAITIFTTISLTGCGHEHTFSEATCTEPKICTECQETEGTALEHNWLEATTENPKTCSLCGLTEGKALPTITNTERGLTEELEVEAETPIQTTEETSSTSVDRAGSDNTVDDGDYTEYEPTQSKETKETEYTEDTKEFLDIIDKMYEMGGLSDEEYKKEKERIIADNGKSDEQIIEEWLSDVPSGGNNVPASDDMQRQFEEALKQLPQYEPTDAPYGYGEADQKQIDTSQFSGYRID